MLAKINARPVYKGLRMIVSQVWDLNQSLSNKHYRSDFSDASRPVTSDGVRRPRVLGVSPKERLFP